MQKQRICCSTFLLRNHDATNVFCFQLHHSKPGVLITQIAAKTAFARGRTANVNASASAARLLCSPKEASERLSQHTMPTIPPKGRQ